MMKKMMMVSVIVSMLLSGCGSGSDVSGKETEVEASGGIREIEIKEVENTWPEQISYQADGVYGNPISTGMETEQPVTLSLACETLGGELTLKITDQDGKEIFSEKNPDGAYRVEIEKAGTYQVLFYAREHVGSVEITPED